MSIIWKPNGSLDVATAPADLPDTKGSALTGDTGSITSYALARCKNLRLDLMGVARTRFGSSKLNATAINAAIHKIIEQAGTRYTFAGTIIYEDETSIKTGLTNAAWSAMLYNAFNDTTQDVFALNGTDRRRIESNAVYEWGIDAPTAAPTVAAGAAAGLTGAYNAKYTYCRKSGTTVVCESNPSPAGAAAISLNNGSLSVTWAASSDSQVTHVRIYRTLLDGATYYHDQDVAIGTVTKDTNTADGSLGSEVATDHNRPPLGSFVIGPNYNGTCFIAKDNLLYFCLPKQPEYWPALYFIEISAPQFPVQCVVFFNGAPYCLTKNEIYNIQGTGQETFFPYRMEAITGAQGPQAAFSVHGKGIFHIGSDGIYLFSGSNDTKISQSAFDPIFRGEDAGGMPGATSLTNAWIIQFGNKLYVGYASAGYTYPTNVLVLNLDSDRVTYYAYDMEIRTVAVDQQNSRLLAGDSDGYVWVLETGTTDNGTAIDWEAQSKDYMLQTRAHFPREAKYDIDASAADSASGHLILDGVVHQTHLLTGNNRDVRRRLVATGNGQTAAVRVSGSGSIAIYCVEFE